MKDGGPVVKSLRAQELCTNLGIVRI